MRAVAALACLALAHPAALPGAGAQPDGTPAVYAASLVWDGTGAWLFGGIGPQGTSGAILRYDPATGRIEEKAVLPSPRAWTSAVWDGQAAYVFGGQLADGSKSDEILRFDPVRRTVTVEATRLPSPRDATAAVWDGGTAHILGGNGNTGPLDEIARFKPADASGGLMPARLPVPAFHLAAAWTGTHAVVAGGTFCSAAGAGCLLLDQVLAYRPYGEPAVQAVGKLPAPRSEAAAAWTGREVALVGGTTPAGPSAQVVTIDAEARTTTYDALPGPAAAPSAAWDGARLVVVGGRGPGGAIVGAHLVDLGALASAPEGLRLGGWAPWLVAGGAGLAVVLVGAAVLAPRLRRARAASAPAVSGPTVLELAGVRVAMGGRAVVHDVSLRLEAGTFMVLLGPSGGGKSSLLKAIAGLAPHAGAIRHGGKRALGYVPQELQLHEDLRLAENAAYFGAQYGVPRAQALLRAAELARELGLEERADARLRDLSGGQRRRASVAVALVHAPRLLVLDEPSSGLDFSARRSLADLLRGLARGRGIAVLASSHFADEAQAADQVGILHQGRLVAAGTPAELVAGLPGGGRCVEAEFEALDAAGRQRLVALLPRLQQAGLARLALHRAYSARYFADDPMAVQPRLAERLRAEGFAVRGSRVAEAGLEDVFALRTGEAA